MEKRLEQELNIQVELILYPLLKVMEEGTIISKKDLQKERVEEVKKFVEELPPQYQQLKKESLDIVMRKIEKMHIGLGTTKEKKKTKKEQQEER